MLDFSSSSICVQEPSRPITYKDELLKDIDINVSLVGKLRLKELGLSFLKITGNVLLAACTYIAPIFFGVGAVLVTAGVKVEASLAIATAIAVAAVAFMLFGRKTATALKDFFHPPRELPEIPQVTALVAKLQELDKDKEYKEEDIDEIANLTITLFEYLEYRPFEIVKCKRVFFTPTCSIGKVRNILRKRLIAGEEIGGEKGAYAFIDTLMRQISEINTLIGEPTCNLEKHVRIKEACEKQLLV